jgi:cytoskeletal protein RodZ
MIDKELIHQAAEDIDIFQADLTEEYDRLMEARKKPRRRLRLWPLAAAACVAGIIVIFLAPPRMAEEQPPLALEEPIASSQEPRVESQQPIASSQEPRVESQESRVKSQGSRVESQESRVESQKITVTSRRPKAKSQRPKAKSQQPIAEPMLTEAEIGRGAHPEMEDPLLAVAAQIQDIRSRGERLGREIAQLTDNKIKYQ